MKLVRSFNGLLAICLMMATLQLHVSEASIIKKLRKKFKTPETCWREKIENHCTTTYEKECSKTMAQQCETTHSKKCTVDYTTECVAEKEEKCVMESKKLCETEYTKECWEEEQKDCRRKPKCNTVSEEVCSTTYEVVCYKKKQKRETGEDRDEMIKIDPSPAGAVDELQKLKTEEILQLSDKSLKVVGKLGETDQKLTREEVALSDDQDSLGNKENRTDFPILMKRNKNRNMSKKRAADLVQKIMDNPHKLKLKGRTDEDEQKDFSSGRSKRSGFVDFVQAAIAGYEEDCEEVARDHCVKVPVEKCHDEQSCEIQTHVKCEEVPFERCWEEPHQRCWEEPKERCWQEPYEKCWQEPQENCWEEPIDECFEVPREKCEDVTIQVESDHCKAESEENNVIKPRKKRNTWDEGKADANMFWAFRG